ncbi:MAG: M56 family metallopeptidase [Pseudomonadota bacterium]
MDSPELLRACAAAALAASVASLLLLGLPRLLRQRFGAGVAYAAWWLLPLSLIAACLPARTVEVVAQTAPPVASPSLPALVVPVAAAVSPAPEMDVPWWPLLSLAWLAGAIGMGVRLWRQQRRFERGLGRLRALRDDLWQAQSRAGLPALLGVVRARIVLPEDFLSRYDHRERRLMLAHERQHRRRGDHLANFAIAALRCAFWFNPLVHLAAARFRHDQELACDEAVIAAHPDSRRAYGEAMLKTLMADRQAPLGCHWGSSHPLKERVMQLKSPLPRAGARRLGAAVVAALALGSGFAVWSAQPARTVSVPAIAGAQPQADAFADASALNDGVYLYVDVDDPASGEAVVPRIALWLKPGGTFPVDIDSEDAQGALSASLAFSIERDARGGMTAVAKVLSEKRGPETTGPNASAAASTAAGAQVLRLPVDADRDARVEHPIGTRGERLVIQARRAPGPCAGHAAAKTGDAATFRCFDRPRAGGAAAIAPAATVQFAGRGAVPPPPAPPEPPLPPAPPAPPPAAPASLAPLGSLAPLPPLEPEDLPGDFDHEAPPAPPAPPMPPATPAPPAPPSMPKRAHVAPQAERIAMAARAEQDAARAAQAEALREAAAAERASVAATAEAEAARLARASAAREVAQARHAIAAAKREADAARSARASAAREAANAERAVAAARAEQDAALAAAARAAKAAADAAKRE